MRKQPLKGKVALVTGATRGIGRGIALQLGEAGALVYITGRTLKSKNGMGSLEDTCAEIKNRGGNCVPVQVDHEDDVAVAALFERIDAEQNGRLDILINNAYKAVDEIFQNLSTKFYEAKPEVWDVVNNVGLRNHYFCTVYAARMMVKRKEGLIVNISSYGGSRYIFNIPYGVGKAAMDRMAADCGIELKNSNVTMISLYPGAVKTEKIQEHMKGDQVGINGLENSKPMSVKDVFETAESTEFSGKCIVHLAQRPDIIKYTSKVVVCSDYAQANGITDIDGRVILGLRQFKNLALMVLPKQIQFISHFIPGFLKVPQFVMDIAGSKF